MSSWPGYISEMKEQEAFSVCSQLDRWIFFPVFSLRQYGRNRQGRFQMLWMQHIKKKEEEKKHTPYFHTLPQPIKSTKSQFNRNLIINFIVLLFIGQLDNIQCSVFLLSDVVCRFLPVFGWNAMVIHWVDDFMSEWLKNKNSTKSPKVSNETKVLFKYR